MNISSSSDRRAPARSPLPPPAPLLAFLDPLESRLMLALTPLAPAFTAGAASYVGDPDVATNARGDTVIAWDARDQDGSDLAVVAQRFDADGNPVGEPFQVNTRTADHQRAPAVAIDPQGNFVIAYISLDRPGVYAQRFDAAGRRVGNEFLVFAHAAFPDIAMDADGNFLIVNAHIQSIHGRRYSAQGLPLGGFQLAAGLLGSFSSSDPSIGMNDAGQFVIAWGFLDVYAQRFSASAVPQGQPFRVNSYTDSYQQRPSVAVDPSGAFAIAWESHGQDGNDEGIYAQRFHADGTPRGSEFPVSSQYYAAVPSAAIDADGDLLIAWGGFGSVYLREFPNDGSPAGRERQLEGGGFPVAVMTPNGNALVVWTADTGIRAQRYAQFNDPASVGGRVWNDANGNGLQDPGEPGLDGVRVHLIANADRGSVDLTTTTAGGGQYRFDELLPGASYHLRFALPSGTFFTDPDQGPDDALDSDVIADARTPDFTLGPGTIDLTFDAGVVTSASISGNLFIDSNADGIRNAGETGLPGWVAFLDADADGQHDPAEPFILTDFKGRYRFEHLDPRRAYRVAIVPRQHWRTTAPDAGFHLITPLPGEAVDGVDFGLRRPGSELAPVPEGPAFRVSDPTDQSLSRPVIASNHSGDVVAVWSARSLDENGTADIYARLYNGLFNSGRRSARINGRVFRVNATTVGDQIDPSVAIDPQGNFVVAWTHVPESAPSDIIAQRFTARGARRGSEIHVDTGDAAAYASSPSIAIDRWGNFTVAWASAALEWMPWVILAQRYDAHGLPRGPRLNVTPGFGLEGVASPATVSDAIGNVSVLWYQDSHDGVFVQHFDANGDTDGGPIQLVGETAGGAIDFSAAMNARGQFVLAWTSLAHWTSSTLYAQTFDRTGREQSTLMPVVSTPALLRYAPAVAIDHGGGYLVTWLDHQQQTGGADVTARRFDATGVPLGDLFVVNTTPARAGTMPAAAIDGGGGDFIIVWVSAPADPDAPGDNIYARRYRMAPTRHSRPPHRPTPRDP